MSAKRKIEIFGAGCTVCETVVARIKELSCPSCEVTVLDMQIPEVAQRAEDMDIRSAPAVVIDGNLASCCAGRGIDEDVLRAARLGKPV